LNSAKQPFDPAPTREIGGDVLIVERNEMEHDREEMREFAFKVNDSDFIEDGDTEQWLCFPPTAKKVFKGNLQYWRVRYEFHHCGEQLDGEPGDWLFHLLDVGYGELTGTAPNQVFKPITINGQTVGQPVLLDGKGKRLSPADI